MTAGMKLIQSIKDGTQKPPAGIKTLRLDLGPEWIDHFEPGFARFYWNADPAYYNLEDAVICSWLGCLADQATFYATNTLTEEGEVTRVVTSQMSFFENITTGRIRIESRVQGRSGDTMTTIVHFYLPDDRVAAMAVFVSRIYAA